MSEDGRARARAIAMSVLLSNVDPLIACVELEPLLVSCPDLAEAHRSRIKAVSSELDGVPLGMVRSLWRADALAPRDVVTSVYRDAMGSRLLEVFRAIADLPDEVPE